MRKILVPLDGSKLAEAILPDALRLAGPSGALILMRAVGTAKLQAPESNSAAVTGRPYLDELAALLQATGVPTRVETITGGDVALSIDEAAASLKADMIACATHGHGPMGRLIRGGVAWTVAKHSSVPVMLRHAEDKPRIQSIFAQHRRIMMPLDGSAYAEKALPVAQELALEWAAPLFLVRVVPYPPVYGAPYARTVTIQQAHDDETHAAELYLQQIAGSLSGDVHVQVTMGFVVDRLVHIVEEAGITDVVMASHGRTGVSRVMLGGVADALIQHLHCPIIVIPALAAGRIEEREAVGSGRGEKT